MISRRGFLALSGAMALGAVKASAQDAPAIIRPPLDGVTRRMSELAQDGPYLHPASPNVFNGDSARYYFFMPKGMKSARLVIFSHGALADPLSYRDMLFHWTSHGFVVAAPLHDDAILESGPTLRSQKPGSISEWNVAQLLEDPTAWKNRVDRCVECIEIAQEIADTSGFELNTDRVVMAGHGYGAFTTQLIMGTEVAVSDGKKMRFRDDRFFAGICMSTQGPGIMGLDDQSWKNVTSPMLHMLSEGDDDFTGQDWQTRSKAFSLSAPGYKHLAMVRKGGPNLFTKDAEVNPANAMTGYLAVKAITACFLKAYGDYDQAAYQNLTDDFFERNSNGFMVEYRR
ncbi:hypothetical protein [Rhizobium sp. BK176]|uniref:alpha/beta hydrolase family protein n=1 Tax=Rhizobium sp. BK176 TaxID=2587071 RepID=UPI002168853D|nr:hypothetical protein [Rhizobium sp. BK176]MCS4089742.1 dienelactone hydrolase [Rhizobium sp. BK176]